MVEALACGAPVVAADGPALREVLDGRATFVEVGDVDGLVEGALKQQRLLATAPKPVTDDDLVGVFQGSMEHW